MCPPVIGATRPVSAWPRSRVVDALTGSLAAELFRLFCGSKCLFGRDLRFLKCLVRGLHRLLERGLRFEDRAARIDEHLVDLRLRRGETELAVDDDVALRRAAGDREIADAHVAGFSVRRDVERARTIRE